MDSLPPRTSYVSHITIPYRWLSFLAGALGTAIIICTTLSSKQPQHRAFLQHGVVASRPLLPTEHLPVSHLHHLTAGKASKLNAKASLPVTPISVASLPLSATGTKVPLYFSAFSFAATFLSGVLISFVGMRRSVAIFSMMGEKPQGEVGRQVDEFTAARAELERHQSQLAAAQLGLQHAINVQDIEQVNILKMAVRTYEGLVAIYSARVAALRPDLDPYNAHQSAGFGKTSAWQASFDDTPAEAAGTEVSAEMILGVEDWLKRLISGTAFQKAAAQTSLENLASIDTAKFRTFDFDPLGFGRAAAALDLYHYLCDKLRSPVIVSAPALHLQVAYGCEGLVLAEEAASITLFALQANNAKWLDLKPDAIIELAIFALRSNIKAEKEAGALLLATVAMEHPVSESAVFASVPALVELMASENSGARVRAACALKTIISTDATRLAIVSVGAVPNLVKMVRLAKAPEDAAVAACTIAGLSNSCSEPLKVQLHQAIPKLISLVGVYSEHASCGAILSLGALAHDDTDRMVVGAAGSIAPLVQLLESPKQSEVEAALLSLNCLVINGANKACAVKAGIIPSLVQLLSSDARILHTAAAMLLCQLALDPANIPALTSAGAVEATVRLLTSADVFAQDRASSTLFALASSAETHATIMAAGALPPLINILWSGSSHSQTAAASIVAILADNRHYKEVIINMGAVSALQKMKRSCTGVPHIAADAALKSLGAAE